jgi:alkylhydroperoxidase family enzyme
MSNWRVLGVDACKAGWIGIALSQGTLSAYFAWANAAKHYDDDHLAALVPLIAEINAWNRLNVISRQPGGDYQPGQWG